MVVQKTDSGVPGAVGAAATELVEEERNTNDGTVLNPEMEALPVWDGMKNERAATDRNVNPGAAFGQL